MPVEVRIPTVFRKYTGGNQMESVQSGTLRDAIEELETRYPGFREQILTEQGELHRFINVYVNDEDVRYLGSLETELSEGDTVSLLPAVAGG